MKTTLMTLLAFSALSSTAAFAETMSTSCTGQPGTHCEETESSCLDYANTKVEEYAGAQCARSTGSTAIYHVELFYEKVSPRYENGKKIYWCSVAIRYSCRY